MLLYGVVWCSSFHAMASAHFGMIPLVWCLRLACCQAFSMSVSVGIVLRICAAGSGFSVCM